MDKGIILFTFIVLFQAAKATSLYIDDDSLMVAFKCGRTDLYKENNEWRSVEGSKDQKNCLKQAEDIVDLCKHVYPHKNIVNVAQMDYEVSIPFWCLRTDKTCKEHSNDPHWRDFYKANATPWKCLNSSYEDKALPVPPTCHFDHISDMKACASSAHHVNQARVRCADMKLNLNQQSPLKSCGLNMFLGIEFVCCPDDYYNNKHHNNNNKYNKNKKDGVSSDDSTEGDHATIKHQNHRKDDTNEHHSEKKATRGSEVINAYLRRRSSSLETLSEHDLYQRAKLQLASVYKERIKQLQKSRWEARMRARKHSNPAHFKQIVETIDERFRKMLDAEKVENSVEKLQLSHLHEQVVSRKLQEARESTFSDFSKAVDNTRMADPKRVVTTLERFIKALHKDRLHTIRHYNHTEAAYAETIRQRSANHISSLDRHLVQALSLLDKLPRKTQKYIKNKIEKSLHAYHSADASFMVKVENDDDGDDDEDDDSDDEFNVVGDEEEEKDYDEDSSDDDDYVYDDDDELDGKRVLKNGESVEKTRRRMELKGGRGRGGRRQGDDDDFGDDDDEVFSEDEDEADGGDEEEEEEGDVENEERNESTLDSASLSTSSSLDDEGEEEEEKEAKDDNEEETSRDGDDEEGFVDEADDASDNDDEDEGEEEEDDDDYDNSSENDLGKKKVVGSKAEEWLEKDAEDAGEDVLTDKKGDYKKNDEKDDDNKDEKKNEEEDDDDSSDEKDREKNRMNDDARVEAEYWRPEADNFKKNGMSLEQHQVPLSKASSTSHSSIGTTIPLGVTVGTLTVAVVIIVGVLVMHRRGSSSSGYNKASSRSDIEGAQPSPEEKHLASMQVNGYENPTYKYFERCQASPPVVDA